MGSMAPYDFSDPMYNSEVKVNSVLFYEPHFVSLRGFFLNGLLLPRQEVFDMFNKR